MRSRYLLVRSASPSNSWALVFSSRVLSLPLLCFGWCDFWKFISHKVVQRRVLGVVGVVDSFIAKFSENLPAKEFWKSVENWQSYRLSLVYHFNWDTVYGVSSWSHNYSLCVCIIAHPTGWQAANILTLMVVKNHICVYYRGYACLLLTVCSGDIENEKI